MEPTPPASQIHEDINTGSVILQSQPESSVRKDQSSLSTSHDSDRGAIRQATLATLDHPEASKGYTAGREWYFHEAQPQQRRLHEQSVIARLCELVREDPYQQGDNATLWYYTLGCLLGDLCGQLFPEMPREVQAWEEACRRVAIEQEREASLSAQASL